jgi:anti-anti-sigma factor
MQCHEELVDSVQARVVARVEENPLVRRRRPDTASMTCGQVANGDRHAALHLETFTADTDCAVLQIASEVDMCSAPQLRERVIQLLADGIPHIIADLREVDFLDSTGLGALMGSLKRLREQDGSLKLVTGAGRNSATVPPHRTRPRLRAPPVPQTRAAMNPGTGPCTRDSALLRKPQ